MYPICEFMHRTLKKNQADSWSLLQNAKNVKSHLGLDKTTNAKKYLLGGRAGNVTWCLWPRQKVFIKGIYTCTQLVFYSKTNPFSFSTENYLWTSFHFTISQLPYPGYSLPQEYEIKKYFWIVHRIPKNSENKETAAKLASEKRRWFFNQRVTNSN